jgi:hypothetical protein
MERKQTRYSMSVGNIMHVTVGNFEDLSLHIIKLLYMHSGWQDYVHVARQLGLNGGTVELRGHQCEEMVKSYKMSDNTKSHDGTVLAALANSFNETFRLRVFEAHEERQILQDALDDLQLDMVGTRGDIERAEALLKKAKDKHYTYVRLGERLQAKIDNTKE